MLNAVLLSGRFPEHLPLVLFLEPPNGPVRNILKLSTPTVIGIKGSAQVGGIGSSDLI